MRPFHKTRFAHFAKPLLAVLSLTLTLGSVSTASDDKNIKDPGVYARIEVGTTLRARKFIDPTGGTAPSQYETARPKNKWSYGAAVGYKFNQFLAADVSAQIYDTSYKSTDARLPTMKRNQKIKSYAGMVNVYLNVPTDIVFTPYITGSAGYARNKVGNLTREDTSSPSSNFTATEKNVGNFAWRIGGGIRMAIYDNIDVDFGYRYISLGKICTNDAITQGGLKLPGSTQKLNFHQLTLGLVYNF